MHGLTVPYEDFSKSQLINLIKNGHVKKIKELDGELKYLKAKLEPLMEIGHLINTQDNRITDRPIFIVQRRREHVCPEGYEDGHKWLCPDDEYAEASETRSARLDILDNNFRDITGKWEKFYYQEHWEFVTACFTEQGCEDYIKRNGHNIGESRVYADTSYRNMEFRLVRDFLSGLDKDDDGR